MPRHVARDARPFWAHPNPGAPVSRRSVDPKQTTEEAVAATSTVPKGGVNEAMSPPRFERRFSDIVVNIEHVVKGMTETIRMVLVAFLSDGHVLLEDLPA